MRLVLLAAMLAAGAAAQDAQLAALHNTLVELRSGVTYPDRWEPTEKLTVAKHQLRDWIEGQLATFNEDGDTKALEVQLNQTLRSVDAGEPQDGGNMLGSVRVRFDHSPSDILTVTTSVGVICQYDDSAYVYQRVDGRWQRLWESEQNDYREGRYGPMAIDDVQVWRQTGKEGQETGPLFVMALGNYWGCASLWHPVTYRVWRLDSAAPKLLIDGTDGADLDYIPIVGSIGQPHRSDGPPDILIEFRGGSIDSMVLSREVIRHFQIDGDHVRRIDPVALGPRDFVDEWLTRPWEETARWSGSPNLRQWYGKLHPDAGGLFGETMHCATPDLWQVELQPPNDSPKVYFLVRWRPPYHFTMVNISATPWPRCTEKDPDADTWRTLFPSQDWR